MGGDKMSHSPYLDSCNMIEKSFFLIKSLYIIRCKTLSYFISVLWQRALREP